MILEQQTVNEMIGARVRARREYLGLRQAEVAETLNTSRGNYSRKEKGEYLFTPQELIEVAKMLRVKVEYFFSDENVDDAPPLDYRVGKLSYQNQMLIRSLVDTIEAQEKERREYADRYADRDIA